MRALSLELRYLIYVAILMALLWIPYILAHIAQVGQVVALSYPEQTEMPPWAARLKRAHYNLLENIPLFAVAVMAGEFRGIHTGVTAACAMIFFWARVAHPIAAMSNVFAARTVAFTVAWLTVFLYLIVVLTA
jgi:uncharacterized MAPEG superfamily protein